VAHGIYACIDPGFLVEKAGRGLYWTLFSEMADAARARLSQFWGGIFEAYVNSVVAQSYGAGGRFIPEPKFPDGTPAFDACLIEGRNLIVFEYKSSTIRADCKYGGDAERLRKELHLKFIDGHDESAKGIAQLSKGVMRFLNGENVHDVSRTDIERIYPSLVCLDNSVVMPYMGRYFNEQFDTIFPRNNFRTVVTPVFTLSISDIENLLGYLLTFKVSDILDSFYHRNSSMLGALSGSEVPLLKDAQPSRNIVNEGFSDFARKMETALFPEEKANQ
jgi:hypothetical protein